MSVDHFERHVASELKLHRTGSKVLVPRSEIERYAREGAARALRRRP